MCLLAFLRYYQTSDFIKYSHKYYNNTDFWSLVGYFNWTYDACNYKKKNYIELL